jgi:hypothetical protein
MTVSFKWRWWPARWRKTSAREIEDSGERGSRKMVVVEVVGDGGRVSRDSESHGRDGKGKNCMAVMVVAVASDGGGGGVGQ